MECFGADSNVGRFESECFDELVFGLRIGAWRRGSGRGGGYGYVSLRDSEVERGVFVGKVNELLAWAGVEAKTEEELMVI